MRLILPIESISITLRSSKTSICECIPQKYMRELLCRASGNDIGSGSRGRVGSGANTEGHQSRHRLHRRSRKIISARDHHWKMSIWGMAKRCCPLNGSSDSARCILQMQMWPVVLDTFFPPSQHQKRVLKHETGRQEEQKRELWLISTLKLNMLIQLIWKPAWISRFCSNRWHSNCVRLWCLLLQNRPLKNTYRSV